MRTKLSLVWEQLRTSLWFVPALFLVGSVVLAAASSALDSSLQASRRADIYFAFGGGVEGARGVLQAIASTMITVTGVIFSITIVALQLASSQFSPRVLRSFMADRTSQVVLGIFIGTFTYTLLILRIVRSADEDGAAFVPSISVGLSIVLALVCIGFLIAYIHHAARSIQVTVVVDRAAQETLGQVDRLFPDAIGEPLPDSPLRRPAARSQRITATEAGYVQAVDEDSIFAMADGALVTVWMEAHIGDFVLPGTVLVAVWPADAVDDAAAGRVRKAFILGHERTLSDDIQFGIRQLVDIALRALSPGINDPTTAANCLDRLVEILVRLGNRNRPPRTRASEDGQIRFVAEAATFDDVVDQALTQIRHYGAADPIFVAHLMQSVGRVSSLVPAACRPVLARHAREILDAAGAKLDHDADRQRLRELGTRVVAAVDAGLDAEAVHAACASDRSQE